MMAPGATMSMPRGFEARRHGLLARTGILNVDLLLLAAAVGLIGFSVFTLAAATHDDIPGNPLYFVIRQAIYAIVGLVLMFSVMSVDYSRFRELRVGLYAMLIGSITLVLVLGGATRGSRRWIELPFFRFQPSELGKVLLIAALAGFILDRVRRPDARRRTINLLLLGFTPATIIFLQPDLGTGVVYAVITLTILFLGGVRSSHFAAMAAATVALVALLLVAAPAAGLPVLKGYQQTRLTAFLHPSDDPSDSGYQVNQALIAVGSGQKTGRGEEKATQTRLDFVPERHTDFIFAVIGERFGFVGAAFVLSLYALLTWRALRILTLSKNLYGTLLAGGIAAMLMFQVFVNVGMSIGIMPVTGVPLPLMSYGGSSVLVTFIAIGILQSINAQAQLTSRSGASPF
ncbi:MAG: rod shape determining protein RodA [Solirubrobacterales bacterium]|jgi:rod shape determining protein RodA|nr:rod shape determining protein RodA [Solirubrobacterales bacterium]MDX6663772.1 rod shape determining protein RodA [Solirubrobacterales bacterium]